MPLYTIGEVAQICHINPVTLRAWQRRYGLLKPKRTDGGHRLFDDNDIARILEIKRWIEQGVQVSKVKALLNEASSATIEENGWQSHQEALLQALQGHRPAQLRAQIADLGRNYPANLLVEHVYLPLRRRLNSQHGTLCYLLSLLDGCLINYVALCLHSAHKKPGKNALLLGWNCHDTTRLWLEAWVVSQQGWRVDVLATSLTTLRPEMFGSQNLLIWCGNLPSPAQLTQIAQWQALGLSVWSLNKPH